MADEILITYTELAGGLSIKLASAKRLVQRNKWVRVTGNDGVARVRVPVSALSRCVADDLTEDIGRDGDDLRGLTVQNSWMTSPGKIPSS